MSFFEKIFGSKSVKTEYAYKSLEDYATQWGFIEKVPGIPLKRERTEENYKPLPCELLDKNACTYAFSAKADGLEIVFKITYDRTKKTVYISAEFIGLDFYRLGETKERLQATYPKFAFTFNRESTVISYFETSKMQYMDDVVFVFLHFTKIWNECGLYEDLLDYYNMFK